MQRRWHGIDVRCTKASGSFPAPYVFLSLLPLPLLRLQPKAELLGRACKVPEAYIVNFSEESIRAQLAFTISQLLALLKVGRSALLEYSNCLVE